MSPTSYQAAPPRRSIITHNLGFSSGSQPLWPGKTEKKTTDDPRAENAGAGQGGVRRVMSPTSCQAGPRIADAALSVKRLFEERAKEIVRAARTNPKGQRECHHEL